MALRFISSKAEGENLNNKSLTAEKEDEVSTFTSFFAGIGSGLFKIPEGFVSLGASLYDLGADTNKAAEVEAFFDRINPFDEMAEASTAGKITELLVSLGIPSTAGFKLGTKLANTAVKGAKAGKYLDKNKVSELIKTKRDFKKGLFSDPVKQRTKNFVAGLSGATLADFVFADESFGTLGDSIGGLTKRDVREGLQGKEEAKRKLSNRFKFAVEGAALGSVLGGGFSLLREGAKASKFALNNDPIINAVKKAVDSFTPEGSLTRDIYEIKNLNENLLSSMEKLGIDIGRKIETSSEAILNLSKDVSLSLPKSKKKVLSDAITNALTTPGKKQFKELDDLLNKLQIPLGDEVVVNLKQAITDGQGGVTQLSKFILNQIPSAKEFVEQKTGQILKDTDVLVKDPRPAKLINLEKSIKNNLGQYLNRNYLAFDNELRTLAGFEKYFPSRDAIRTARRFLIKNTFKDEALTFTQKRERILKVDETLDALLKGNTKDLPANMTVDNLKKLGLDIDDGILKTRKNVPEELRAFFGEITDPAQKVAQTIAKQTATISQVKMINDVYDAGKGKIFFNSKAEAAKALNISADKIDDLLGTFKGSGMIPTKMDGKWTLKNVAESLIDQQKNTMDGTLGKLYSYMILTPKAISQQAKTIFSPFTHLRNFLSASAFVMMNGNWFTNPAQSFDLLKKSFNAFSRGKGNEEMMKSYLEYMSKGMVGTNPVIGELGDLSRDVLKNIPSAMEPTTLLGRLMKPFSKARQFVTDLYAAEDDFFKIYNYGAEQLNYTKAFDNFITDAQKGLGLPDRGALNTVLNKFKKEGIDALKPEEKTILNKLSDFVSNTTGRKVDITDPIFDTSVVTLKGIEKGVDPIEGIIKNVAADITKNNIPNYAYVGDFIKGLRKLPFGTFVAFPAEIVRTGLNTLQRGIREVKNPFTRGVGMKRLAGVATTSVALPLGAVELGKQMSGFTDEQMLALRKFVPYWSENGLLVPTGIDKETGNPTYIDLSYIYPYDTLVRPATTLMNELSKGEKTEEALTKSLFDAGVTSMAELARPFVSESIFFEAVNDIVSRGGLTREGNQIYRDKDPVGEKVFKAGMHVIETFSPGSLKQIDRIVRQAPFNVADKYGQTYDLANEWPGIFGFRKIVVDPTRTFKFMLNKYRKDISSARGTFLGDVLKGGEVSPEKLMEQYMGAEMERFKTFQEMSENIKAAKALNIKEDELMEELKRGITKTERGALLEGTYLPYLPSKEVIASFDKIAQKLSEKTGNPYYNPMDDAFDSIIEYYEKNLEKNLSEDSLDFDIKMPVDSRVGSFLEGFDFLTRPETVTPDTGPGSVVTGQGPTVQGQGSTLGQTDVRFRKGTLTDPVERLIAGVD